MKNTKNIFKKVLMVLCTFALCVPVAFGLIACDGTSNGGSSGKWDTGDALQNDWNLFAKSVVAGIDYIETDSSYEKLNILGAFLVSSATSSYDETNGMKVTISVAGINNSSDSVQVYELFYTGNRDGNTVPAHENYSQAGGAGTYTFTGTIQANGKQYIFNAERKVSENKNKLVVSNDSTIEISKSGNDDRSFKVEGTTTSTLNISDGKSGDILLKNVKMGSTAGFIEKATFDSSEHEKFGVANEFAYDANELVMKIAYDNENESEELALKVYPSVVSSGDAS